MSRKCGLEKLLQVIFGVISFHAGVYLQKYNRKNNIFRTAYYTEDAGPVDSAIARRTEKT